MFANNMRAWAVVAMAAACVGTAMGADRDFAQEAKDRAEIEALMWQYVRALDTLDADAYASVFTEDGRFGAGPNATMGRPALKKMIMDLKAGRAEREAAGQASPPMYHVVTNPFLEFTGPNQARLQGYWMTVFGAAGEGGQPRVAAAGREVDELVRVDGRWLIKSRNVAPRD
jgi:uncharacterized protein (TIGR02246 family)